MEPTEQNLSGRVMDQPKEVPQGTISIARSKRTAQHADHHDCEIKTRKAADKAARVQQRAGELVQQLSQEDDGASHKARGLLATAEKRQNADSKLVHPQLWPDDDQQVSQPSRLQKDPLTKVHYHEPHAPRPKSTSPPNRSHKKRRSPVKQTNSDSSVEPGITPVDSDRPDAEATSGNSQDRTRTQSPPGACSEFGSTQKLKHSLKSNPNMTAILDRQIREQTNQNHPQDYPDDGQSVPPVVDKLKRTRQRAHNELEAAERESSDYRFAAEAGQRFVSNARRHKAKLDVAVYEHGRETRAHVTKP